MRIEKYLVLCGIASRKKIKKYISEGLVSVNEIQIFDDSLDIDPEKDIVLYNNNPVKLKELKYYIFYKIAGYITAMEDEKFPTVADLLPEYVDKNSVFPVGRLDKDTEGLLIFTNDGDLNYKLTHPDKKVEKKYFVKLDRPISLEDIKMLESGVTLDTNYKALPGKVEQIDETSIYLTITEGKFHQVKKMIKAIKNKVIYLKRVEFANLTLKDLRPGEIREIKREEIEI